MEDLLSYTIGDKIGSGLNGEVFQYSHQEADMSGAKPSPQFAIKVFKTQSEFKVEEEIISQLNHPNIIKMVDKKDNQMIMKYYHNGDLFDFLQSDGREIITEEVGRYFFKQILKAVEYLHDNNIIHRDIKLENILVDEDFNLILSDFGLSSKVQRGEMLEDYIGTSSYMAPEIVQQRKYYGQSSDLFALGVILFCIMVGTYPFQSKALPTDHHYKYFVNKQYIRYWLLVEKQCQRTFSPSFKSLINSLLSYDMNERITMEEIKEHDWLHCGPTATPESIRASLQLLQQQQAEVNQFDAQNMP